MLNKIVKIGLATIFLAFAIYQFTLGKTGIGNGILFIILSGLVILLYFKNENILMSFYYLRKNNFPKASKALDRIKSPEHLIKSQEAYYYFLKGLIEAQSNIMKSERYFKRALSTGLKYNHDQAIAKLNLAGVSITRRRKREATTLLTEVKKLDTKGMLKDQIKMVKEQMKRI